MSERMELPISGPVTRILLDFAFSLEFGEAQDAPELTIAAPFELTVDGQTRTVDPAGSPTDIAPALAVKHQTVEFAHAATDGSLHLRFANQIEIRVPAESRDYEPWQLVGMNGWMIGVTVGGSRFEVPSQSGSYPGRQSDR